MVTLPRRLTTATPLILICVLLAALATAAPARGEVIAVSLPDSRSGAPVVGGVTLGYLPGGLGATSDFTYDYDEVDFSSRVWESRTDDGGYRVDLDVTVMRHGGARLRTGRALRDWFIAYEERVPVPAYRAIRIHGGPGWRCGDQVFWLVRPGLAVSVQVDPSRWSGATAVHIARVAVVRADVSRTRGSA